MAVMSRVLTHLVILLIPSFASAQLIHYSKDGDFSRSPPGTSTLAVGAGPWTGTLTMANGTSPALVDVLEQQGCTVTQSGSVKCDALADLLPAIENVRQVSLTHEPATSVTTLRRTKLAYPDASELFVALPDDVMDMVMEAAGRLDPGGSGAQRPGAALVVPALTRIAETRFNRMEE